MAANYARQLPQDRMNGLMVQSPPAFTANAALYRDNGVVSSVQVLNSNTTVVELTASSSPVGIRWTTQSGHASVVFGAVASFDDVVAPNQTRIFVVPRSVMGTSSVVGANVQSGLYPAVAIKNVTNGSVLLTEY